MADPPEWLIIRQPHHVESIPGIDPGEQAAIALAVEVGADLLLIDDLDGRRAAQARGITITGTLGVLDRAAERSLLDLRQAIDRLQATSIRLSDDLITSLLARRKQR